jgi:hypothetical protein
MCISHVASVTFAECISPVSSGVYSFCAWLRAVTIAFIFSSACESRAQPPMRSIFSYVRGRLSLHL